MKCAEREYIQSEKNSGHCIGLNFSNFFLQHSISVHVVPCTNSSRFHWVHIYVFINICRQKGEKVSINGRKTQKKLYETGNFLSSSYSIENAYIYWLLYAQAHKLCGIKIFIQQSPHQMSFQPRFTGIFSNFTFKSPLEKSAIDFF